MGCRSDFADETPARLHQATRLLCEACKTIDSGHGLDMSPELRAWWTEHKKMDAVRENQELQAIAKEVKKKVALSKLTQSEIEALGL